MQTRSQFSSTRPRAPLPPTTSRVAPVAPLLLPAVHQCHYLRRSVVRRSLSQSESSVSHSDFDESEDDAAKVSAHASDSDSSESDTSGTSAPPASSASLSSRSTSQSSLSDSDDSRCADDHNDDALDLRNIRISRATRMNSSRNGGAWLSDNLGVIALLVPITGVSTMVLTEVLACANHFDCSKEYPTLSYAAEFKPEGYAFTLGMCTTSLFIQASAVLFHWFERLKLFHPGVDRGTVVVTHFCVGWGTIAATSLFGLAVFDMGAWHDTHVMCTVVFFISAWAMMISMQAARHRVLRDQDETRLQEKKPLPAAARAHGGVWYALQRWKRMSLRSAYQLGNLFLFAGLTATGLFGLLYKCVNGMWSNPLGFTPVQEALLEAFAILCQLFFMGTLSCELSKLTRVVEHRDYDELERAE